MKERWCLSSGSSLLGGCVAWVPLGRALCEFPGDMACFCGTVFGVVFLLLTRMTRFERLAGQRALRSDG